MIDFSLTESPMCIGFIEHVFFINSVVPFPPFGAPFGARFGCPLGSFGRFGTYGGNCKEIATSIIDKRGCNLATQPMIIDGRG